MTPVKKQPSFNAYWLHGTPDFNIEWLSETQIKMTGDSGEKYIVDLK